MPNTNDQPIQAPAEEASLSPEVADYFGVDQPSDIGAEEQVNSEGTEDNQTADKSTDEDQDVSSQDTEEVTAEADDSSQEDEKDETDTKTFEVAGRRYETFEQAVEAVNKINGNNAQLAGEIKFVSRERDELKELREKDQSLIQELQAKLQEWEDFSNGDRAEKPDSTTVAKIVEETLQKRELERKEEERKKQYAQEIDAWEKEPDYAQVYPKIEELVDELGDGIKMIPPSKLYQMARGMVKGADSSSFRKVVSEQVNKEISKTAAKKVVGGNARQSGSVADDLSSEVADYINSVT